MVLNSPFTKTLFIDFPPLPLWSSFSELRCCLPGCSPHFAPNKTCNSQVVHLFFFLVNRLQHTRPPCLSPTPGVYSNSCPLSWWCHPTISSSVVPLLLLPSIFPSIRVFSNESVVRIRWPKYWNFSISPSNEYSGLIFRMDWLDLLALQGTQSLFQNHSSKASIQCSAFFVVAILTSIHDHWKNHGLDLFWQSNVCAF